MFQVWQKAWNAHTNRQDKSTTDGHCVTHFCEGKPWELALCGWGLYLNERMLNGMGGHW